MVGILWFLLLCFIILIDHPEKTVNGLSSVRYIPAKTGGLEFRASQMNALRKFYPRRERYELWKQKRSNEESVSNREYLIVTTRSKSGLFSVLKRLDTLESSGLPSALTCGVLARIKSIHNPKFYIAMMGLAMLRWTSLVRNYYAWILLAFLYKWYRARYVYKVPVWDRQPNWNNIITSKEQEKDLKAYTCKNCGSTIFIAKSREFFFEGVTGIGGLGCFNCGAKGADNFVMDRDRILEDVAE